MTTRGVAAERQAVSGRPGQRATRRGALGTLAGAAGVLAVACAPRDAATGAAPGTGRFTRPVTLSWAMYSDKTLLDAGAEGARLFTAKYPAISVQIEPFEDAAKNTTAWIAGAGPHVAMSWGAALVDSGRRGIVAPLDAFVKRDARAVPLADYVEFQLKATQWPGVGQFALPMYINVYGLYYNRALFQKKGIAPPDGTWDWSKYQEALTKVADRDQGVWGGVLVNARLGNTKINQNGATVVDPADDRKAGFASAPALEALQWVHDRVWRDRSWALATEPKNAGFKDGFGMLAGGKLATFEQGSYAPAQFAKDHPAAVQDWDVVPLPRGKQRGTSASIDSWVIWKDAPVQDEAWEFMKFLQTAEWLDVQARMASYQHPRISMQDHYVELMKKSFPALAPKNLAAFAQAVKERYARPAEIFRKDGDAWKIIQEAWDATMVRNESPVSDTFRDAARRVDAAMI